MNTEEMIAVMQAYVDGKEIQYCVKDSSDWIDTNPAWNWIVCDYRVKPEPRKIWVTYDPIDKDFGSPFESEKEAVVAAKESEYYPEVMEFVQVIK